MGWLSCSSDLNPIANLWDYRGRVFADLNPFSRSLDELQQELHYVPFSIPVNVCSVTSLYQRKTGTNYV
ncbi:hypothetical protein TNCV_4534251 [Trichonephila clavipes]|nr:hypothetical protein TNCV_4534251 [Trichonephila clavipes]